MMSDLSATRKVRQLSHWVPHAFVNVQRGSNVGISAMLEAGVPVADAGAFQHHEPWAYAFQKRNFMKSRPYKP